MINKVILIGNAGIEPEVRSLESGAKVARLRLATTEKYTVAGEHKEHTEWHTVILWRAIADFVERYVHKGTTLYVEGRIRSREKTDEYGAKKTIYEIHGDEVRILKQPESVKPSTAPDEGPSNTNHTGGDGIPF